VEKSYKKSPLKYGEDEKKASASATTEPVRVGNKAATLTRTEVRSVKKSAEGSKVSTVPGRANRTKKPRSAWKGSDASLAAYNKRKRAEWDAQDKKAEEAAAKYPSDKTSAEDASKTQEKVTLDKTEGKTGTRSSTFHPWEQRQQNRREKIVKRQERQMGRQELRRDWRSMKNSAEWDKMSSAERKAAKYEFKHGKTKDQTNSNLDRFGKDFSSNVEQSRKRKEGQGELNKAQVRQEVERPGEATTTQMDQNLKGARRGNVGQTNNYEEVTKTEKAGQDVILSPEEQAKRRDVAAGTTTKEATSSTSSEKSNTPNSDTNVTKASDKFKTMMANQNSVLGAKPSDYKSSMAKPAQSAPTAESKFTRGEKMMEEETPLKMKKSNFGMKGFGSKSGYNFNKNK